MTRSNCEFKISRPAAGTCELAKSTRSPPAMIQKCPASSSPAASARNPKCSLQIQSPRKDSMGSTLEARRAGM